MALRKKREATLGNQVKDVVSGMKGTLMAFAEHLSGTVHCTIQAPMGKGKGEEDKSVFVDVMQVEYVGEGIKAKPLDDTSHIVLGDFYRDVVTGFEGYAVMKLMFISGCTQVCLQPKIVGDDKSKVPEDVGFDWKRIEFVEKGPVLVQADPVVDEESAPKPTTKKDRVKGGPFDLPRRTA